jgi:hypothetical protein
MTWRTRISMALTVVVTLGLSAASTPAAAQSSPGLDPAPTLPPPPKAPPLPPPSVTVAPPAAPSVVATPDSPPPTARLRELNPLAFRADIKLPFLVSTLYESEIVGEEVGAAPVSSPFAPVPQLVLGTHCGRIGIGLGLGFSRFALEVASPGFGGSSMTTYSDTELMVAPTLTVDVFQSDDAKVALYLLGAPIFGDIIVSNDSSIADFGFQFALGARYALHDNFQVGLEAGPLGHFYYVPSVQSGEASEIMSSMGIYTAIVGSFVYPR